jgi:hypothetical protein
VPVQLDPELPLGPGEVKAVPLSFGRNGVLLRQGQLRPPQQDGSFAKQALYR